MLAGARRGERGRLPHQGTDQSGDSHRSREVRAVGRVSVADVQNMIQTAVGGQATHANDRRRQDVRHHRALPGASAQQRASDSRYSGRRHQQPGRRRRPGDAEPPRRSPAAARATSSTGAKPAAGRRHRQRVQRARAMSNLVPQRRLGDLVTPVIEGARSKGSSFGPAPRRSIASKGSGSIAVKFGVRGRDLASTVAEAKAKVAAADPSCPTGRMERRVPGNGGSRGASRESVRHLAGTDLGLALHGLPLVARRGRRARQRGRHGDGRRLGARSRRPQFQHLGGRRVHLDLRRGRDERIAFRVGFQSSRSERPSRWTMQ